MKYTHMYNLELKHRFFKYILDVLGRSMSHRCDRGSLQKNKLTIYFSDQCTMSLFQS